MIRLAQSQLLLATDAWSYQMKNPQPDIMGHLMAHTPDNAAGRTLLNAESRLIIGAGR